MATSQITVAGQAVTVAALPGENPPQGKPRRQWFRSVEFNIEDAIALSKSIYTGGTQSFEWPGAEELYGTCELPPMVSANADLWRAFLMQCRGMLHPFRLGDPLKQHPTGRIDGHSSPVCDTAASSSANLPMSKLLQVRGLKPSVYGLMKAGDALEFAYRLHWLLDDLSSDPDGRATAEIWPSIREQPADGAPVIVNQPRGLFRLASNKRTWSYDFTRLSSMSVPVMEWR